MNINLLYSKKRTLFPYSLEIDETINLPHLWENNSYKIYFLAVKIILTIALNQHCYLTFLNFKLG